MEVIKRDGRKEKFNVNKIIKAVSNAYKSLNLTPSEEIESKIRELFTTGDLIDIEEIQDKVQYPGEIKVNVIRETRAVNYAK